MKVYWVEGHGALIGSANLSGNGLAGGLTEVLAAVRAEDVSIPDLIQSFKYAPQRANARSIAKLKRGNDRASRRGRGVGESAGDGRHGHSRVTKYPEWYTRMTVPKIKLGWYTLKLDPHAKLEAAARSAGFADGIADFNGAASESTYAKDDWILMLRLRKNLKEMTAEDAHWMRVDGVTELTPKEAKAAGMDGYPWAAWQGDELRQATPFSLKGARIQDALRAAWREHAKHWLNDEELIDEAKLAAPPGAFFASVLANYEAGPPST